MYHKTNQKKTHVSTLYHNAHVQSCRAPVGKSPSRLPPYPYMSSSLGRTVLAAKVSKTSQPMKAVWKGAVIAESDRTVVVEGNHYFPPNSLNHALVQASDYSTVCGWKGRASYYDIVVDKEVNKDAAWYYPHAKEKAKNIEGYLAFWKGVKVSD